MDLRIPSEWVTLAARVRGFVEKVVMPHEMEESIDDGLPIGVLETLRQQAREAGLWAPQLPKDWGGLGLGLLELCLVFEEAGRSPIGPIALHCAAPDEGNMHLLLKIASPDQQERFLRPLAKGETRSCFAMTEPAPGAGSDPSLMKTRAERTSKGWKLNGHKWFCSGAEGAAFTIVAAVTDPLVAPKHSTSLFLVETDRPGYELVRKIPTLTGGQGGHCEVRLNDCEVPESHVLGSIGEGFKYMQARLGPARLTHCMRWLGGAKRCLEVARRYAKERTAFGKRLEEHQGLQWMFADSVTDLHASRLLVLQAAWKLEQGERARVETSLCKIFVAEAVSRVVDRAVQICGGMGIAREAILERFYREVRAFRIYDGASEVHRMVLARSYLESGELPF